MSETIPTTDSTTLSPSDAPSSSAVETSGAPPAPSAPADSSAPPSSSGKDATSPSSGDSRQSDREGLLAAVRSVVDRKPPASEGDVLSEGDAASATSTGDKDAAPGAPGTQERKDETTSQGELPDPTEAQLRQLRPETRRRFEQLIRQRNEARQVVEGIRPELMQHRELASRIQEAQLAPDDLNQLLFIGSSLRKQDYRAFLEGVTPYVMAAQEALGLRIAADLKSQVDDGTLSEEAAREFTRTRHRAAQAEQRLKDQTSQHTTEGQTRTIGDIRSAVTAWEANIRARDPDYVHKADTVRRFSQGFMQEQGTPQTPEQAVALVQAAYEVANRTLATMRPRPQPTQRNPSSVHVATGGASAEPRSMLEAAQQALAKMRRAS